MRSWRGFGDVIVVRIGQHQIPFDSISITIAVTEPKLQVKHKDADDSMFISALRYKLHSKICMALKIIFGPKDFL